MECVIKGTKTIQEYKDVLASMEERAQRYSKQHMVACENWQEGLPVKCWRGAFDSLWIEYESGNCWQYRETSFGLEWL